MGSQSECICGTLKNWYQRGYKFKGVFTQGKSFGPLVLSGPNSGLYSFSLLRFACAFCKWTIL